MAKDIKIEKFHRLKADIKYQPICEEYADKTMRILKNPGVSPSSGRPNRTTPYWQGWIWTERYVKHGMSATVWNETNWQLTHLLENGHFVTNLNSLVWVHPRKHIKPTFDKVAPRFVRAMRKADIEVKIN